MAERSMMTGLLCSVRQQPQLKGSLPKGRLQPEPLLCALHASRHGGLSTLLVFQLETMM